MCRELTNPQLQNVRRLPTPVAADNGKYLKYDFATNTFVWAVGGGGAGFDVTADYSPSGNWNFSNNVVLAATPSAGNHALNRTYADARYFSATGGDLAGTNGNGYIGLQDQSAGVSAQPGTTRLFSNGSGYLSWRKGSDNLNRSFKDTGMSASRIWTLPDMDGTFAMTSDLTTSSGLLKTAAPLDATARYILDYAGTQSLMQFSTSRVNIIGTDRSPLKVTGSRGGGLYFGDISSVEGAVWAASVAPSDSNYAFYVASTYLGINSPGSAGIYFNVAGGGAGRWSDPGLYIGSGAIVAGARLHVRAASTLPIARFDNNSGVLAMQVDAALLTLAGNILQADDAKLSWGTRSYITGNTTLNRVDIFANSVLSARITQTDAAFSGTLTTGNPAGDTAKPFKVGSVSAVGDNSGANNQVRIDVNGTAMYVLGKSTPFT